MITQYWLDKGAAEKVAEIIVRHKAGLLAGSSLYRDIWEEKINGWLRASRVLLQSGQDVILVGESLRVKGDAAREILAIASAYPKPELG